MDGYIYTQKTKVRRFVKNEFFFLRHISELQIHVTIDHLDHNYLKPQITKIEKYSPALYQNSILYLFKSKRNLSLHVSFES